MLYQILFYSVEHYYSNFKNNILFLTDNKKNPKKRWSKFFRNAFVFNNYRAAARIAAQYKYNNTRVAKLEK